MSDSHATQDIIGVFSGTVGCLEKYEPGRHGGHTPVIPAPHKPGVAVHTLISRSAQKVEAGASGVQSHPQLRYQI